MAVARSFKVFATGQARVNLEHYVIKMHGQMTTFSLLVWLFSLLLCVVLSLSNLKTLRYSVNYFLFAQ